MAVDTAREIQEVVVGGFSFDQYFELDSQIENPLNLAAFPRGLSWWTNLPLGSIVGNLLIGFDLFPCRNVSFLGTLPYQ